jgi:FtsZ-interacting cell division protein YlmF
MGGSAEKKERKEDWRKKGKQEEKTEKKKETEKKTEKKKRKKNRGEKTRLGSHANREKERKGLRVRLQRQFAKPSQKLYVIFPQLLTEMNDVLDCSDTPKIIIIVE